MHVQGWLLTVPTIPALHGKVLVNLSSFSNKILALQKPHVWCTCILGLGFAVTNLSPKRRYGGVDGVAGRWESEVPSPSPDQTEASPGISFTVSGVNLSRGLSSPVWLGQLLSPFVFLLC